MLVSHSLGALPKPHEQSDIFAHKKIQELKNLGIVFQLDFYYSSQAHLFACENTYILLL